MDEAAEPAGRGLPLARREFLAGLVLALVLAAWPVREGLFDPDRVYLGVDTATVQLPWSASEAYPAAAPGEERPRNPALSDQGLLFYPGYRWISRSWREGDPPLWNPWIYAGVPALGNPQMGVLDPQVGVLVLLEALGGVRAFHWGLSLMAWLRIFAAGFGAWLLARCLGLRGPGAALAGAAFALTGFEILWLNQSLGHVPPLLPWVLLGLERIGGPRPGRAMAGTALALLLAILGGHPETSFFVGATAGLWALAILREDRVQGLRGLGALALGAVAGTVSLWPFLEYLERSAAHAVRTAERGGLDVAAVGLVLVGAGLVFVFRRVLAAHADESALPPATDLPPAGPPGRVGAGDGSAGEGIAAGPPASGATDAPGLAALDAEVRAAARADEERAARATSRLGLGIAALGLTAAIAGLVLLLGARGLPGSAAIALWHDLHGAPGQTAGGYVGPGTYLEEASGWIAPVAFLLALAGLFSARGPLRRRGIVAGVGFVAWLLCLRTPGLLDLYRLVPVVGLGATVRLAAVSSLLLALLAGEALQSAGRVPRATAAAVLLVLFAGLLAPRAGGGAPAPPLSGTGPDEHVGFLLLPPAVLRDGPIPLEGWLRPGLRPESVRVRVERVDPADPAWPAGPALGPAATVPTSLLAEPSAEARAAAGARLAEVPEGATFFRAEYLDASRLDGPGVWRLTVELVAPGEERPMAERIAAVFRLERPRVVRPRTLILAALGLLGVLLLPRGRARAAAGWGLAGLALVQGLTFAEGMNPAVPSGEAYPPTRTEAILAAEQGEHRFFGDPGVLPPSTGLVRGLRALDGYDGMDTRAYNEFRFLALKHAGHGLLGWNARGVDLASAGFRLLGVAHLALATRLAAPGWELIAGPTPDAPRPAEVFLYRAVDPFPRAFCVARVATPDEVGADLAAWDPREVAVIEADWRPARPFTHADARIVASGNDRVLVRAELDGDGLLVLTDQAFPGWVARVDGERRPILTANALFRGVPLAAGEHEVEFRYEPVGLRVGIWISLAALLGIVVLFALPRRVLG